MLVRWGVRSENQRLISLLHSWTWRWEWTPWLLWSRGLELSLNMAICVMPHGFRPLLKARQVPAGTSIYAAHHEPKEVGLKQGAEGGYTGEAVGGRRACHRVLKHMYDPQGGIRGPNQSWRSSVLLGGKRKQERLQPVTPGHCTSDSPFHLECID